MRRTLASAALLAASLFPVSAAALLPGLEKSASCSSTQGRDVARCSIDTMKQWQRDHYNYHEEEGKNHTKWHLEHDPNGVTPENLKAHRDFHEHAKRVHNVFHDRQKTKERQFEGQQSRKRVSAERPHKPKQPTANAARFEEGKKICARYKSEQTYRSCIKPYLRQGPSR